ncbi:MAG TPA: hypothetical protein VFH27_10375 [Longimicrobiaceae bacterium]|nr:hypothetical protein [Longimicrobiaceae bacterium]
MHRKLTITVDDDVYTGLYHKVGAGKISQFIEDLIRPHVLGDNLFQAYAEMAADDQREADAAEWSEGLIGDVADETR